MKINDYSVAMNAQYYNLKMSSTETEISSTSKDLSSDSELKVAQLDEREANKKTNDLSAQLSKAVLKNISPESKRLIGDKVEISTTYVEAQALSYSISALIKTDDKEIAVSLDINLSRSFVQQTSLKIENINLSDPLVINLDGTMPSLSSKTFSFDIDSDGEMDQISQLNARNGFLALDKNDNGQIDNGSELFGTQSGNGFADLAKYDDDKNGWIDENDKIFEKLRIWQNIDGKSELTALGEKGIGAIFLGTTQTPFSLKSETNEVLGEIRSSSFIMYEDGRAGVISQIDFALTSKTEDTLSVVEKLTKDINALKINDTYKSEAQSSNEGEDRMGKLQSKIKALENKLHTASDEEKPAIQAQIGLLHSQMMALLEVM